MTSEGITELSLEDIAALDIQIKAPRKNKSGSVNTQNRDFETWFKLRTTFGFCENPKCTDQRPAKVAEGNAMVAVVKDKSMCRICFLAGWLK
jgi:hypothetical protein